MSGFITLHREAFSHPLLKDGERFRAWFWMVSMACWKPTKFDVAGKIITLERGQFCTSRSELSKAFNWSPSAVERFLTRLETEQMIGREAGQGKTVITICNYGKYQDEQSETGQATGQATGQRSDSHRTAKEQGNKGTSIEEEANASPSKRVKPKTTPAEIPDWVPAEAWNAFVEMRIRKGAKPTDRAVTLLIRKLDEFRKSGHDPGAVLDQSTLKNWTDVYEIKDERNGNRSQANRSGATGPYGGGGRTDGQQVAFGKRAFSD